MHCSKTEKGERIGIFGGAFDPPHKGHVRALETFLHSVNAHRIYVFPSGKAPHKVITDSATAEQRLEMARLAFEPLSPAVSVDDWELKNPEISFTYRTVEEIRRRHPEAELYLFMGTDQFLVFETWKNVSFLVKECVLCPMARDGDLDSLIQKKEVLEKEFGARCLLLEEKAYIISSTRIREELKQRGFSSALPAKISEYVTLQGLYGALSDPARRAALEHLKKEVDEERLFHTLAVEREVSVLCEMLSEKEDSLRIAALYHDFTRRKSAKEQEALLSQFGISATEEDWRSPAVLHGVTGAALAEEFGLKDPVALDAIRYHTTGRDGMTREEKILCFADYIEETRPHFSCRRTREAFYESVAAGEDPREALDRFLAEALEQTVAHLREKQLPVHSMTLQALKSLKKTRKERL